MFNVGPEKLILLFAIALLVLGPHRLPDAARTMGKAVAELRRLSANLRQEARGALGEPGDALSEAVTSMREGFGGVFAPPEVASRSWTAAPGAPGAPVAPRSALMLPAEHLPTPDDPSLN